VIATDPSEPMLRLLTSRAPAARALQATAENIPVSTGSVDAVVSAQAFHWFDTDRALPEIARVLRPGGVLGLVWNHRDERIPWVRRLGALVGGSDLPTDPSQTLVESRLFGFVESTTFRFWQPQTRDTLRELVLSRSNVVLMSGYDRERVLRSVDELYEGYGRGADGMLLPYVTRCYRTTVRPQTGLSDGSAPVDDTDALLIDFR
jgi:SAM-dependent methyltransferase